REWALEAPLVGLIGALDAIDRRPDVQHDLAKIDLPTLVLTGELNDLVPPAMAEAAAAAIPYGEAAVIAGAGWFSHLESPGPFNETVLSFLQTL
ncbi:MAG TPA: alpha/beta hydrolase, partial [Acidimicrobiales bacterium]|nr:alpha/beta hydrolase [Acidimicrobiales bacterium]